MDNQRIILAIYTAASAHDEQLDRKGMPYILHPLRVGAMGKTEDEIIVGLLHDTLEDTNLQPGTIRLRFGSIVLEAVQALTRPKEEHDYQQHIEEHVAKNEIAIRVKINDLKDNMSDHRNTDGRARVIPKYVQALAFLQGFLEAEQQVQESAPSAAKAPLSGEIGSAALPDSIGEPIRFHDVALKLDYPLSNGSSEG